MKFKRSLMVGGISTALLLAACSDNDEENEETESEEETQNVSEDATNQESNNNTEEDIEETDENASESENDEVDYDSQEYLEVINDNTLTANEKREQIPEHEYERIYEDENLSAQDRLALLPQNDSGMSHWVDDLERDKQREQEETALSDLDEEYTLSDEVTMNEPIVVDGLEFTIAEFDVSVIHDGGPYYMARVFVKNTTDENKRVYANDDDTTQFVYELVYDEERLEFDWLTTNEVFRQPSIKEEYEPAITFSDEEDEEEEEEEHNPSSTHDITLQPDEEVNGLIAFTDPRGVVPQPDTIIPSVEGNDIEHSDFDLRLYQRNSGEEYGVVHLDKVE